jgi:hypothetical protein
MEERQNYGMKIGIYSLKMLQGLVAYAAGLLMRCEVLVAVNIKITVLQDVTPVL